MAKYIAFYNTKRPHAAMSYKIPERVEKVMGKAYSETCKLQLGVRKSVFSIFTHQNLHLLFLNSRNGSASEFVQNAFKLVFERNERGKHSRIILVFLFGFPTPFNVV